MQKKYNYFYKITNKINNHYYYGIHSTDNINDGYMGSGKRLRAAYKTYGVENFNKEILKYFKTRKEASDYENAIVTESVIEQNECYNIVVGGENLNTIGKRVVLDKKDGNCKLININDYENNRENYVGITSGLVLVKDVKNNKCKHVTQDEYYSNKELYTTPTTDSILVKDKNGNIFRVNKNDERYLSGELTEFWKGRHHTKEAKQKMSETHKANGNQKGEKNSQFGKCWITKDGINKSIRKEELEQYIVNGWCKGRKLILQNDKISFLDKDKIIQLHNSGLTWIEIAKQMGVSEHTIYNFKRKNNIYNTLI